jgi:hypothetical protein
MALREKLVLGGRAGFLGLKVEEANVTLRLGVAKNEDSSSMKNERPILPVR